MKLRHYHYSGKGPHYYVDGKQAPPRPSTLINEPLTALIYVTATDSAAFSDSAAASLAFTRGIADTFSPGDIAAVMDVETRPLTDSFSPSDSATGPIGETRDLTDTLSTSDTVERDEGITGYAVDTFAHSDQAKPSFSIHFKVYDSASVNEACTNLRTFERRVADIVKEVDVARTGSSPQPIPIIINAGN
jgi:hypothetical protein